MGKLATKFTSILLSITLIIGLCGESCIQPSTAYADDEVAAGASSDDELKSTDDDASADDLTVLAFTSDVHNMSNDTSATRTATWLNLMADANHYGHVDAVALGGDLGSDRIESASDYFAYSKAVIDAVDGTGVPSIFTTGNHEFDPGDASVNDDKTTISSSANPTAASRYLLNAVGKEGDNYIIYCLGSEGYSSTYANQVASLKQFLDGVAADKTIFIVTHFPLHYASGRVTTSAGDVIDVLNAAAASGKKIVFIWGHNHSNAPADSYYDEIFIPGCKLQYAPGSGSKKTIDFYYCAAGCMCDSEYFTFGDTGSKYVLGKGLVVTINSKDQLSFAYYNAEGAKVTDDHPTGGEGSGYAERDSIPIENATMNEAVGDENKVPAIGEGGEPLIGDDGQPVLVDRTVEVGRSLKLHYTVEPADATIKRVTWSSNDESVATVSFSGKVKGVSVGIATITATFFDDTIGGFATARAEIAVTPRLTDDEYYVIMIDDYALSSNVTSEILTNSSGFEYHGLEAVMYNTGDPAPHSILWTIEEVDDVDDGYYIGSYNGDYLSSTYKSNGSGWTGTLTVGSTKDIWVAMDGADAWTGDGTYLKSTNGSDNTRPVDIYLTYRASGNEIDFFTVGSPANYKQSTLVVPNSIIESHALDAHEAVPATCTAEGTEAYWSCSACKKLFSDAAGTIEIAAPVAIPKVAHTPADVVRENAKAATCEQAGSYDELVRCTVCGAELSREAKTVGALGHNWDAGKITTEPTVGAGGVKTFTCANDATHTKTEAIAKVDTNALDEAIAEADKAAQQSKVSTDGTDIDRTDKWATQKDVDDLAGAIEAARDVMANPTSTKAQVDKATKTLVSATKVFLKTLKPGTRQDEPPAPTDFAWTRLAGPAGTGALDTMAAIIDAGNFQKGGTVVLASLEGYWDALTAAGIAGLENAPVVVTPQTELDAKSAEVIKQLAPSKIVICGGTYWISDSVVAQAVTAAGTNPPYVRLSGDNAAVTAAKIAEYGIRKWSNTAIVATAGTFQDSLAAAPVSYAQGMPIFLAQYDYATETGYITDDTIKAMKAVGITQCHIVGGEYWLPMSVHTALEKGGIKVLAQLGGASAVETSGMVADLAVSTFGMNANEMGAANVMQHYDALACAAFCGQNNSVLVLVRDGNCSVADSFVAPHAGEISHGYVFGGTASVSDASMKALEDAAK